MEINEIVKGIGVDIVDIGRVEKALVRHQGFASRLFTSSEQEYCLSRKKPSVHFALRFAAKEAVLKALGIGFRGVKWTDLEICRDSLGKPLVCLNGNAALQARARGIDQVLISLSFNHHNAVASAIAVGTDEKTED